MRILITGSAGKIGRELVKVLNGHNDLLMVDKKTGCNLAFDNLDFIKDFKPEVVFHLAASFERTDETQGFIDINYEDNILATYRLNKVLMGVPEIKQYVYASSYLVYDSNLYLASMPIHPKELSEVDEINPRNLIGAAKLYGECEINFLKRNVHKDMKVTHARIFRVFGEGGQEFISRIIEWKQYGLPVDVWKPENKFDFINTVDCAEALKALIGHEGIYNVGSGKSTSIQEIISLVEPKIRRINMPDLFEASCADIYKIQEVTGWEPKINVLDWIRTQL